MGFFSPNFAFACYSNKPGRVGRLLLGFLLNLGTLRPSKPGDTASGSARMRDPSATKTTHARNHSDANREPNPTSIDPPTSSAMSSSSNGRKKQASGGPTIRTLADINSGPAGFPGAGGGGGSDSDEPQEYYTGGEKRYIPVSLGRFSPSCGRPSVSGFAADRGGRHRNRRRRWCYDADVIGRLGWDQRPGRIMVSSFDLVSWAFDLLVMWRLDSFPFRIVRDTG
jgi:hypothetical protein